MVRLFGQRATEQEQRDELLSAYVDDQLSTEERAGLEAQLAIDPELRVELDALRQTVALVRDLPPVPVPRNFILSQTAAARPQPARQAPLRRAWAAPFLTAASVVFSLLFAVVLAGDLLLSGAGGMASAPMPQKLAVREMEMPQEAPAPASDDQGVVVTVQTEAEVVVEAEAEAAEFGKAVSVPTPSPASTEVPLALMPVATPELEGLVAETGETEEAADIAPGGGGPVEEPAAPASAPMPSLVATDTAEDTSATLAPGTAMPGTNAGVPEPPPSPGEAREETPWAIAEGEAVEEATGATPEELEQDQDTRSTRILPWRALEIVLGLTSLGLIGVTIWAWRVRRR